MNHLSLEKYLIAEEKQANSGRFCYTRMQKSAQNMKKQYHKEVSLKDTTVIG